MRTYPSGELADEARGRLAELKERRAEHEYRIAQFYEQRRHPVSARLYYAAIVDEYALTSWTPKAAARIGVLEQKL